MKEENGESMVLLVTSRETGRWVLPKGWAERRLKGAELAAKEAFEEAGVVGQIIGKPIGSYTYLKFLPKDREIDCLVKVFPMRVDTLLDSWPEAQQRRREWFTVAQAAKVVNESELATLLLSLRGLVSRPTAT